MQNAGKTLITFNIVSGGPEQPTSLTWKRLNEKLLPVYLSFFRPEVNLPRRKS